MSAVPVPGSWIKKEPAKDKPPFVLADHLTTRPLRKNADLLDLKKRLKKGKNK